MGRAKGGWGAQPVRRVDLLLRERLVAPLPVLRLGLQRQILEVRLPADRVALDARHVLGEREAAAGALLRLVLLVGVVHDRVRDGVRLQRESSSAAISVMPSDRDLSHALP